MLEENKICRNYGKQKKQKFFIRRIANFILEIFSSIRFLFQFRASDDHLTELNKFPQQLKQQHLRKINNDNQSM